MLMAFDLLLQLMLSFCAQNYFFLLRGNNGFFVPSGPNGVGVILFSLGTAGASQAATQRN
jgi:hypothetical protein